MATVAKLNVQIGAELKGLEGALKKAESGLQKFAKSATAIGSTMSTYLTAPIVGGLTLAVKSASDAEETFSKFATIFRDVESSAENAFRTLTDEYNMSNKAAKELLGNTGDLLTGFGFTQDEALKLSLEVNKLAADLSSFNNFSGGAKGASEALTKALLGEREALKSLGISVQEENVKKQVALNISNGIIHSTELQAKAYATLQLATQQSGNAVGDVSRTMDSFANQLISVQNAISNLTNDLGKMLIPMAKTLLERVKTLVKQFQDLSFETKSSILNFTLLLAAIGPVVVVLGQATLALSGFAKLASVVIANPFTLVYAGAFALVGILAKLGFEYVKTKNLLSGTDISADMPISEQITTSVKKLSDLQSRLAELQEKQASVPSGGIVGTYDITIQQLRERIQEERNALIVLIERSKQEQASANASLDAVQNTVAEISKIQPPRIPVTVETEPIADVVKRAEDALRPIEDLIEFDYNVPEKLFPVGSIGFLQTRIANLTELMRGLTNPEDIEAYRLKIEQLQNQLSNLENGVTTTSGAFEFLSGIANQFTDSFGAGLANVIVQGEKLRDVLKNIGKLLLSAAIQKGISILLTGGLPGTGFFGSVADGGGGGIFGKLFRTRSNDALITSTGRVIEFSPKDNILAMQDFDNLQPSMSGGGNIHVTFGQAKISGTDLYLTIENVKRTFR